MVPNQERGDAPPMEHPPPPDLPALEVIALLPAWAEVLDPPEPPTLELPGPEEPPEAMEPPEAVAPPERLLLDEPPTDELPPALLPPALLPPVLVDPPELVLPVVPPRPPEPVCPAVPLLPPAPASGVLLPMMPLGFPE